MTKSELILRIANLPGDDVSPEKIAALAGGDEVRDEILTAAESCRFLKISRSTLWRRFPPTMKIGSLPRWSKTALLTGGGR